MHHNSVSIDREYDMNTVIDINTFQLSNDKAPQRITIELRKTCLPTNKTPEELDAIMNALLAYAIELVTK